MLPATVDSPRARHFTLHSGAISEQPGLVTGTNTRTQPPFERNDRERDVPVLRRQTRMDHEGRLNHSCISSSPRHGKGDITPTRRGHVRHRPATGKRRRRGNQGIKPTHHTATTPGPNPTTVPKGGINLEELGK